MKPYWTLLFSDILLFAKVSRDRVLFITEEPVPLIHITESIFNVRKKCKSSFILFIRQRSFSNFVLFPPSLSSHRIPTDNRSERENRRKPNHPLHPGTDADSEAQLQEVQHRPASSVHGVEGGLAEPPPAANVNPVTLTFRSVSLNFLLAFLSSLLVNSAFGHTPLSSPLESPDVMQLLLPAMTDATTTSMASIKLSSASDSLPATKPLMPSILNQVRPNRVVSSNSCSSSNTTTTYNPQSHASRSIHHQKNFTSSIQMAAAAPSGKSLCSIPETESTAEFTHSTGGATGTSRRPPPLEFSLSSVGRSFFESEEAASEVDRKCLALKTPDTPSANITPSSSSNRFSDKSFTDSRTHEYFLDMGDDEQEFETNKNNLKMMFDMKSKMRQESYCGSWDLLEIDLDFHEVNLDPSFGGDVQEYIFMGDDDPFGVLPAEPTKPDTLHL